MNRSSLQGPALRGSLLLLPILALSTSSLFSVLSLQQEQEETEEVGGWEIPPDPTDDELDSETKNQIGEPEIEPEVPTTDQGCWCLDASTTACEFVLPGYLPGEFENPRTNEFFDDVVDAICAE
ncbi:MAG: hypothetical protein GY856_55245 [bacterium]|nr:hypothetical protein [bacterium]